MPNQAMLSQKIGEVIGEMKRRQLWSNAVPAWVQDFSALPPSYAPDFIAWLQWVYLPNVSQQAMVPSHKAIHCYVAPQAAKCLSNFSEFKQLLTLLVELDALM